MRTTRRCWKCGDYCDEFDANEKAFYCKHCDVFTPPPEVPIETVEWMPIEGTPYVDVRRHRTIQEVFDDLAAYLESVGLLPDEYFEISFAATTDGHKPSDPFPLWHWIACYPVTGKSEGHYIHIETISMNHEKKEAEHLLVFLGKTFQGFDFATRVANECARALGT